MTKILHFLLFKDLSILTLIKEYLFYQLICMKGANKYLNNFYCLYHPTEKLNLICIQRNCSRKGLMCSFCKNQVNDSDKVLHDKHQNLVVPFKFLIQSLEENLLKKNCLLSNEREERYIEKLEQVKIQMLTNLRMTVQKVAKVVQKVQQSIIDEFQTKKDGIMSKSQILSNYKRIIDRVMIHDIRKEEKFQLITNIKRMVPYIAQNKNNLNHFRYELSVNSKATLNQYIEMKQQQNKKCILLEKEVERLFSVSIDQIQSLFQKWLGLPKVQASNQRSLVVEKQKQKEQQLKVNYSKKEITSPKDKNVQTVQAEKKPTQKKKKNVFGKVFGPAMFEQPQVKPQNNNIKPHDFGVDAVLPNPLPNPLKSQIFSFLFQGHPNKEKIENLQKKKIQKKNNKDIKNFMINHPNQQKQQNSQLIQSKNPFDLGEVDDTEEISFCSQKRSKSIKIMEGGKTARQTGKGLSGRGFIFVDKNLKQRKQITFKIRKLKGNIGIGVGLHDIVSTNAYGFLSLTINHGVFLIDNEGVQFNHLDQEKNKQPTPFHFSNGHLINLKFQNGILHFNRQSDSKKNKDSFLMPIKLSAQNMKVSSFCVLLTDMEDCVQIL